jgi:hypothetical protein
MPAQTLQVIQHLCGILSTKPKITKNIPALPILSVEIQDHTVLAAPFYLFTDQIEEIGD